MKKYLTLLLCSLCALACFSASAESAAGLKDVHVVLSTTKGDIELALYPSKAPVTVANFLNLASRGYYRGITFHRVIPNFMIQGGDPTGTGMGGPGYSFEDEFSPPDNRESASVMNDLRHTAAHSRFSAGSGGQAGRRGRTEKNDDQHPSNNHSFL